MLENIRLSFQGIFTHKLRSFLTMLGIIIGIASIIAIVSTIKGTNEQIKENLVGAGDNNVKVTLTQSGMDFDSSNKEALSKVPLINDEMLEEMKALEGVKDISIYHTKEIYSDILHKTNTISGAYLYGIHKNYLSMESYQLESGRLFIDSDYTKYRNVCILDSATAYSLFSGENPINGVIEIYGKPFVVVGVVRKFDDFEPVIDSIEEWSTYYGDSTASSVFFPDTCWPVISSYDERYQVLVKAKTTEDMTVAGKGVQDYLNDKIPSSNEEDAVKYKSENTLEKAKELQRLSSSTSSQLIWIASISLLVGGIGVMNIMLVSVTERTREIGLKKAIGARKGVILGQFLTEAAVLTSLGGVIGVVVGIILSYIISNIAEVKVAISVPAIIISVAFSMVIGIVFGLIPSVKASNLNPIDALRYE